MPRKQVRKIVEDLISKYETNDPLLLCSHLGVDLLSEDLGNSVMGIRTRINRISIIILNSRNSDSENFETLVHELGHHCCGHNTNVEYLKRDNRAFVTYGVEYEANCFMVELLLYGANLAEHPTKQHLLNSCGVPDWAERYVDWRHLEAIADFSSFNSYF